MSCQEKFDFREPRVRFLSGVTEAAGWVIARGGTCTDGDGSGRTVRTGGRGRCWNVSEAGRPRRHAAMETCGNASATSRVRGNKKCHGECGLEKGAIGFAEK